MQWVGLLVGAFTVSVAVDVQAPAATCAWSELVPASLARLATVEVEPQASVRVLVQVAGSTLTLSLIEGEAAVATRALPADGACEARADGVALVVEQQLRALGYVPPAPAQTSSVADVPPRPPVEPAHVEPAHVEPAHVEPAHVEPAHVEPAHVEPAPVEPAPAPVEAPPSGPSEVAGTRTPTVSRARAEAAPGPVPWTGWARLGGYAEFGAADLGPRGGGRLGFEARRGRFAGLLSVWGLVPSRVEVVPGDARRGKMTVWTLGVTLGAEACFDRGPGAICGQLRAGLERAQGTSEGELLFGEGTQSRLAPVFVGAVRYRYPFAGRFAAWIAGEGIVRPSPTAFAVEGAAVVEDPGLALGLAAGVSAKIL